MNVYILILFCCILLYYFILYLYFQQECSLLSTCTTARVLSWMRMSHSTAVKSPVLYMSAPAGLTSTTVSSAVKSRCCGSIDETIHLTETGMTYTHSHCMYGRNVCVFGGDFISLCICVWVSALRRYTVDIIISDMALLLFTLSDMLQLLSLSALSDLDTADRSTSVFILRGHPDIEKKKKTLWTAPTIHTVISCSL